MIFYLIIILYNYYLYNYFIYVFHKLLVYFTELNRILYYLEI